MKALFFAAALFLSFGVDSFAKPGCPKGVQNTVCGTRCDGSPVGGTMQPCASGCCCKPAVPCPTTQRDSPVDENHELLAQLGIE